MLTILDREFYCEYGECFETHPTFSAKIDLIEHLQLHHKLF